jgi:hypothetical protein
VVVIEHFLDIKIGELTLLNCLLKPWLIEQFTIGERIGDFSSFLRGTFHFNYFIIKLLYKMLITLQSNSDEDASDFVNFFRETIMIQPKSELALVNASYEFTKKIVIATPLSFQMTLGGDGDIPATPTEFTMTLAAGTYTRNSLISTLNQSIADTYALQVPYYITKIFPAIEQGFSVDNEKLKIELQYSPADWTYPMVSSSATGIPTAQVDVTKSDGSLTKYEQTTTDTTGGNGIINRQSSAVATGNVWTNNFFVSGESSVFSDDSSVIWGTAEDTAGATPHGSVTFKITKHFEGCVAFNDGKVPTDWENNKGSDVGAAGGIWFDGAGNFQVYERGATNLGAISASQACSLHTPFTFHFSQVAIGSTSEVEYFYNGAPIALNGAAPRFELRPELKIVCGGCIKSLGFYGRLLPTTGTGTLGRAGMLNLTNVSFQGTNSGYLNGELATIGPNAKGGSQDVQLICSAAGVITGLQSFQGSAPALADNFTGGESGLTITGKASNNATATATALSVIDSCHTLDTSLGAGAYVVGAGVLTGATSGATGVCDILAIDGGNMPTSVEITSGDGFVIGEHIKITNGTGTEAKFKPGWVEASNLGVHSLKWSTVRADDVDEPLVAHVKAGFSPSTAFTDRLGLGALAVQDASGGIEETGDVELTETRASSTMLVNVEQFQIKSICKDGGIQKAVASLPMGAEMPQEDGTSADVVEGKFYKEPYNILYHTLENPGVENHNQLRVRITDPVGNPLTDLKHPTTITLDLRPKGK